MSPSHRVAAPCLIPDQSPESAADPRDDVYDHVFRPLLEVDGELNEAAMRGMLVDYFLMAKSTQQVYRALTDGHISSITTDPEDVIGTAWSVQQSMFSELLAADREHTQHLITSLRAQVSELGGVPVG